MMRRWLTLTLWVVLAAATLAIQPPGDEAGDRKLLETWLQDTDHAKRLKQNRAAFVAMTPAEQNKLRQLDKSLHELDETKRKHLDDVMERYVLWLERLPAEDRTRINAAPAG